MTPPALKFSFVYLIQGGTIMDIRYSCNQRDFKR